MTKAESIRRLKQLVAWDEEPHLSEDDLADLIQQARVVDRYGYQIENTETWNPLTTFWEGDVVVPPYDPKLDQSHPGMSYIATTSGITGAAEPSWGAAVIDGTVHWQAYVGASWTPTYNLNYAAYQGWLLKGAKAASRIAFTADGATFHREQYLAHCERMARKYAARLNASPRC